MMRLLDDYMFSSLAISGYYKYIRWQLLRFPARSNRNHFLVVDRHDFCFVCAFIFLHWIKSTASNLARLGSDIVWC